mgnify:CR=1 FL=1
MKPVAEKKPWVILRDGEWIGFLYAEDEDEAVDKASVQYAECCGFELGDDTGLTAMHPAEAH